ncbi:lytic polysaccharide monooxygenase [Zopfia rhizophila CBS 207.26]|uniref:AA9 family lytic polysaccharide monooxygenase n=1 Tax=Zopfia rhizophila CBS 207.26 TaxID=1314779 RepID=A0A6A6DZR5_9PEZI|nr:lytic polysaccharide monooxygenase [Zopfia rhizophila CBS 207.26]
MTLMASADCVLSYVLSTSIGVYVNGVDQELFEGVRTPAYNGPPGSGYSNSPVKDLNSIDLRCNVMGDKQAPNTTKMATGDNLTFDWYKTMATRNILPIADSSGSITISETRLAMSLLTRITHEGLYEGGTPGKWSTTSNIAKNHGQMNIRIPKALRAGQCRNYLFRAEMIGLYEGEVFFEENPIRGAQFYPNCVQIEVTGNGTVELHEGVSFPGAYSYDDPDVVYHVYCSTKTTRTISCITTYPIPGPTVWSGAWAGTTSVHLSDAPGDSTAPPWSTWVKKSVVTSAIFTDKKSITVVGTSTYQASWLTTYQTPVLATKRW